MTRVRRAATLLLPMLLIAAAPTAGGGDHADARFDEMIAAVKAQMLTDPARAITDATAALDYAHKVRSPRMEATAMWLQGEAYSRAAQPARAAILLANARRLVEHAAPGTQLNADILLSEGGVLNATGEVGRALANLQLAYDMYRKSGDTRSQAKALIMIALVHVNGNDQTGALRYFDQAAEAYRADPGLSLAIHNGRAQALKDLGRLREAEREIDKALIIARDEMSSKALTAQVLSNVADIHLARGDRAGAERAVREGLALTRQADVAVYRPIFVAWAARMAFERGDTQAARLLIDERFRDADLTTTLQPDRMAHDVAYRIYTKLGLSALALPHLAALKRLDDQATETARSNSAAIATARFDFANQELRIAQLKAADLQKSVAFERARARTQQMVLFGAVGSGLLIITLLAIGLVTIRRSRNALAVLNTALGKALAAKTEFLATTSHEIRTPLNGILGMTQVMLADPKMDSDTRERLSLVHGAGTTMRALVDDILDVAKMETGKMTVEEVPIDLRHTILDAARMWQDQARAKGLTFTLDVSDAPAHVIGDDVRLRQIVFNLLSNAVKFTPAGRVEVCAQVIGDRWQLVVRDTGIGIAPDKHDIIFEPFRQADAGTTRQYGGTGLGLSICRNLARAMGGDVTVESEAGAGATFTLDLPCRLVEVPTPAAFGDAPSGVLVIDRSPIARAMFKALLAPRAGTVTFAGSVEEALEQLVAIRPATLLVDDATLRATPDHVAAARSVADAARGAAIALLGPPLEPGERDSLLRAGVTRIITKPIGKEALITALFSDEASAAALVSEAA